mmetsp:Transcript_3342/g.5900  ORF Transcript_3342/g.5900 Transcript_3342/m.5900 type:complete len:553 (+) Transcript_3342:185-1843(+)
MEVVTWLSQVFSIMDELCDKYQLDKIKTIGDAYMVGGALCQPSRDHLSAIADFALEVVSAVQQIRTPGVNSPVQVRIGIHVGPVVAGIIGTRRFLYDVWGDTVNIASRLESTGQGGRIQVSQSVYERLQDCYKLERRGRVRMKGKGDQVTYWLIGRKNSDDDENLLMTRERAVSCLMFSNVNDINEVDFCVWRYDTTVTTHQILVRQMLHRSGLLARFPINDYALNKFIAALAANYHIENPFHNFLHALDAMHCIFLFLRRVQPLTDLLQPLEQLVLLVAILCHDADHPGLNNIFQERAQTELALIYNGSSILESHHCSIAYRLLSSINPAVLGSVPQEHRAPFRQIFTSCILATDMARHDHYMRKITKAVPILREAVAASSSNPGVAKVDQKHRTALLCMLMKCADLCNSTRSFDNSRFWAERLQEEYFLQGDEERERGLPVSFGMDRYADQAGTLAAVGRSQVSFLEAFALPCYEAVQQALPDTKVFTANIVNNINIWRKLSLTPLAQPSSLPGPGQAQLVAPSQEQNGRPRLPGPPRNNSEAPIAQQES